MADKEVKKEEIKQESAPAGQPQPTKEQMLQATFQTRLNGIVTMMNDLYRDVREIVSAQTK